MLHAQPYILRTAATDAASIDSARVMRGFSMSVDRVGFDRQHRLSAFSSTASRAPLVGLSNTVVFHVRGFGVLRYMC